MAFVSHEHKLVFFAAPGTGSSAVIRMFLNHGIGEMWPKEDLIADGKRVTPSKHSTIRQLNAGGLLAPLKGYFRFAGVRNPFSWYVAIYLRNRTARMRNVANPKSWIYQLPEAERDRYIARLHEQYEMSFAEYLRDLLGRHKAIDLQAEYHRHMHYYMHQERLTEDFELIKERCGLPPEMTVPVFNVTGAMEEGKDYRDFYTPKLIAYVYKKNRPFFRKFPEYEFDGLKAEPTLAAG
jgi:hypothetical protein